jgi:hypothetical protein
MLQFGGMHVPHPLGGYYSSWVSLSLKKEHIIIFENELLRGISEPKKN